ncbi:MAG: hypothetical protein U1F25_13590 [Rubrivivax sp.]
MAETKPGDLVGQDAAGRVRIDRVIPLPWLLGGIGAIAVQGMALYYSQQQTGDTVRKIESRLDALVSLQGTSQIADAELRAEVRELRRRIESMEARR